MSPEQVFSLCGMLVLPGWLLLVFVPRWKWTARLVCPVVIPLVLALVYLCTRRDDVRADAGRLRLARGGVAALLEPAGAARRVDSLPRLRPLHGELGGARRAERRHPPSTRRALPRAHFPLRPRGAPALLRPARRAQAQVFRRWRGVTGAREFLSRALQAQPRARAARAGAHGALAVLLARRALRRAHDSRPEPVGQAVEVPRLHRRVRLDARVARALRLALQALV